MTLPRPLPTVLTAILAAGLPSAAALAQEIPALTCSFDRTCTSDTDCTPADLAVSLTAAVEGSASLIVEGKGERVAVVKYSGGLLHAALEPAPDLGLWILSLPEWPADAEASFAEAWPAEGKVNAWLGRCAVSEAAE